jgi:ribosome maturation factor RimP
MSPATGTADPVASRVAGLAAPLAEGIGAEVLEVEVGERQRVVRVVVDVAVDETYEPVAEGLDIETIAELSRQVSAALDEVDPIAASYTLEVCSPGTDRPLIDAKDFARNRGREVRVTLADESSSTVEGTVESVDGDGVVVASASGRRTIPLGDVERALVVLPW